MIKEVLTPEDYNFIVTPKEIDDLIENMKDVVARGINFATQNKNPATTIVVTGKRISA